MAKSPARGQRARDAAPRKFKKKTSPLVIGKVEYVDYKDVDLLSRFMSDRGKIRGQRINGNDVQQQRRGGKRHQDRTRNGALAVCPSSCVGFPRTSIA